MQYIADAAEAKEIDSISIRQIGIPSVVLMERAAMKVADCVCRIADADKGHILAVCGMGNNGADGVAAVRILRERGYHAAITLAGDRSRASEEMKIQLEIAERLSVPMEETPVLTEYAVIIDAVFGIGLSREILGVCRERIEQINASGAHIVSVDIPSGIDATTGKVLGTAVKADDTVTFGLNKRGLVLFPGTQYAGRVHVQEIGFPKQAVESVSPKLISYEREDIATLFPKRMPHSNKGTYGRVLVIAGSEHMGGAALFSAAAAYCMGSGLVRVFTHENNRVMLQTKLPEALITTYGTENCRKNTDAWRAAEDKLTEAVAWAGVIIIGPGLGTSPFARQMLHMVLRQSVPIVVDADALNLLSECREYFDEEGRLTLPSSVVLTPHVKEMSRLCKKTVAQVQSDLIEAAQSAAKEAVIVLKDARTVVTDGQKTYLNVSGNNALAKGGSGDVLSGMIGGLLAQHLSPFLAASLGVYLHGLTAEEYVKEKGHSSMLASDSIEELKRILP